MVPIAVERRKIVLCGVGVAVGRNTLIENAGESLEKSSREPCGGKGGEDGRVVTVCADMGPPNPADKVRDAAIKME